jgi:hypothetical protein
MSISYPLNMPGTPGAQKITLTATNVVGTSVSPFTKQTQVYEWPGEAWSAQVALPPMKRTTAEAWVTFLTSLRGMSGTFYIGDPLATTPLGVATGTPQVHGGQTAGSKTLATKGWSHSVTGILLAGDYIQVGTGSQKRLYKVLTDADSDSSGDVTLDIFPRLREALSDAQAITVSSPQGTFRLDTNDRSWDVDEAQIYGIQFTCTEAI